MSDSNDEQSVEPGALRRLPTRHVLQTPLALTSYADLARVCVDGSKQDGVMVVVFTNTMIVSMRRHEPAFRALTRRVDCFVPDGMPLIWCLNSQGAGLRDRVYGPAFMRHALRHAPPSIRHYFLGGSEDCLNRLITRACQENPGLNLVGKRHGSFKPEDESAIVAEINRNAPDWIWVGLGTANQQAWIERWRDGLSRGLIFAVGCAFDVNTGTKPDVPDWMHRAGLTWLFRLAGEPRRSFGRHMKYICLFLYYLILDTFRGRAFAPSPGETPHPPNRSPR